MEQVLEVYAETRPSGASRVQRFVEHFLPGKDLVVIVKEKKAERSNSQNKALWGCAYKYLREQTGNESEELHEFFCGQYFGWEEYEVMGKRKVKPIRTTTKDENGKRDVISKSELKKFYGYIQRVSAEGGHYVPDPDPNWFQDDRKAAA